jgi:hypothetical protein
MIQLRILILVQGIWKVMNNTFFPHFHYGRILSVPHAVNDSKEVCLESLFVHGEIIHYL